MLNIWKYSECIRTWISSSFLSHIIIYPSPLLPHPPNYRNKLCCRETSAPLWHSLNISYLAGLGKTGQQGIILMPMLWATATEVKPQWVLDCGHVSLQRTSFPPSSPCQQKSRQERSKSTLSLSQFYPGVLYATKCCSWMKTRTEKDRNIDFFRISISCKKGGRDTGDISY